MDTIKSNEEISRIFSSGKRSSNSFASFVFVEKGKVSNKKNAQEHDLSGRVAFIAGKKLGNAVWRNTAKRRLREVYRANADKLQDLDILFIARSPILDASYSKVLTTCEQTLERIRLKNG